MQRTLILIAALAFARDAYADAKTQKMATGYQREARNCKIQSDGVTKILAGATAMQADDDDASLAADVASLRSAQEPITAFCTELGAMIELLRADPAATYKSLEPQLAERDKKLRELRKAFKQAADSVTPIIRRLVPRINKRAATAARTTSKPTEPAPAPAPAATPPSPPPTAPTPAPAATAPVKITEGPTTSLAVRSFTGGTCDDHAKQFAKAEALERQPPKKRAAGTLAWLPGARWRTSYASGDRFTQIECVATKGGGVILTLEGPNPPRADRDLLDVATRALAATAKP
jgi:hypothetical protein